MGADVDERTRESDERTRGPAIEPEPTGCRTPLSFGLVFQRVGRRYFVPNGSGGPLAQRAAGAADHQPPNDPEPGLTVIPK
jgi:hypothetical protein